MADVDITIGIGRTIVQDVAFAADTGIADQLVKILILPFLQAFGFAIGEIAAHREFGVG